MNDLAKWGAAHVLALGLAASTSLVWAGHVSDGLLWLEPYEERGHNVSLIDWREDEKETDTEWVHWIGMPVLKPNYRAEFTMAIIGGKLSPAGLGAEKDYANGFELAYNSPFLQPRSGGRIRQQWSHVTYNHDGVRLASFEMNPHYWVRLMPGIEAGGGVGIGLVEVGGPENPERAFAWQAGVSVSYRNEDFFIGAEVRRQFSDTLTFEGKEIEPDNTRVLIKFGFWL